VHIQYRIQKYRAHEKSKQFDEFIEIQINMFNSKNMAQERKFVQKKVFLRTNFFSLD